MAADWQLLIPQKDWEEEELQMDVVTTITTKEQELSYKYRPSLSSINDGGGSVLL